MSNDESFIAGWEMVWAAWNAAARSRKHPFHTFTLATMNEGIPDARTIVLRAADPATRTLQFNVDMRSPKAAQLLASPVATCVFYDELNRLQVRTWGNVTVHHSDAVSRAVWDAMQHMSRECYRTPYAPGSAVVEEPLEPLSREEAYANMGVCHLALTTLEWMHLLHTGHRRARYEWVGTETPNAVWLHP